MGRKVITVFTGRSPGEIVRHARQTQSANISDAIGDAADDAVNFARMTAPVYDPLKWPQFARHAHHHTPPGTLKRSINRSRVFHGESSFLCMFRANAKFASHVEQGFRHHLTRRRIKGKRFMWRAMNVVFRRRIDDKLDGAMIKTFVR